MSKKYRIFDIRDSLMEEYPIIEASSGREAIDKYLKDEDIKVKASGSQDVSFKTTPFIEKDGQKYRAGRATWWEIIN